MAIKIINNIRKQMTNWIKVFATYEGLYPQYIKKRERYRIRGGGGHQHFDRKMTENSNSFTENEMILTLNIINPGYNKNENKYY